MKNWLTILAAIIVVVLVIGVYKAKSDASKTRSEVHRLEQAIADKQADVRALRAEIATRESPREIEALARQHLGLAPAQGAEPLPERDLDVQLPAPQTHGAHP